MTNKCISSLMFVLIFMLMLTVLLSIPTFAYAADNSYPYDATSVETDLTGAGIDLNAYQANPDGDLQILSFLEYGYSTNAETISSTYALYLYVYNPAQAKLSRSSANNKINIAVEFDDKGYATKFERLGLIFCSRSDDLYYKYRVADTDKLLESVKSYAAAHNGARRYDVSNAEFLIYGNTLDTPLATEIGKSYEITGYMRGFGEDKDANTFSCKAYSMDVLDIDLNHTFFRPEGNNRPTSDHTFKDQLDSVYFTFPNNLIKHYGGIYKIDASYYATSTKPMLITSSKEVYDIVKDYIGKELEKNGDANDKRLNTSIPIYLYDTSYETGYPAARPYCNLDWNHNLGKNTDTRDQILYYLFYTGGVLAKDYVLSADDILKYIYTYDKSNIAGDNFFGLENGNGQKLTLDLFDSFALEYYDNLPEGSKVSLDMVYVPISITAEDNYTLESYKRSPTAFDWFPLCKEKYDYSIFTDVNAIEPVDPKDISMSKDDFCSKYYIDSSTYEDIIDACNRAITENETVYLFRFAQSEYSAGGVKTKGSIDLGTDHAYICQQTVYLNMNVCSITCRKGEEYKTFAVCSNPINATSSTEPFVEYDDLQWYKNLLQEIKSFFISTKDKWISAAIAIGCILIGIAAIVVLYKLSTNKNSMAKNKRQGDKYGKRKK